MEPEETQTCSNCKREIPTSNLTIHVVHCSRNIGVCAVCKEPVPRAMMSQHHDAQHKLLPCQQCGESVCGTDLEDHIRDSCANTIKTCRFCELELPRREIPNHENYCGVRTEQCPECKEWVMIKYRQLHLDSNHGFLRLDDDPAPVAKNEKLLASSSNGVVKLPKINGSQIPNNGLPRNIRSSEQAPRNSPRNGNSGLRANDPQYKQPGTSGFVRNLPKPGPSNQNGDLVNVGAGTSNGKISQQGAIKKRIAPKPPSADPRRDLPFYSAVQRQQQEELERQEQSARNLSMGLPPVLSPAAKLEKLRKMDALQNRETEEPDYRDRLRGRVWMPHDSNPGFVLGSVPVAQIDIPIDAADIDVEELARNKHEFENVVPMSPQEFMERFRQMQLGNFRPGGSQRRQEQGNVPRNQPTNAPERGNDRFNEIKSSLRELRRGLNEVTAPYNSNVNVNANANVIRPPSPVVQNDDPDNVRIPCEFCTELIPVDDLVQHQTGCRPDLVQYNRRSPRRSPRDTPSPRAPTPRTPSPPPPMPEYHDPVIPCEFCTKSLPIYLINEHQERCARDANLLYPD